MDVAKSIRSKGNMKGKNISWQKVCNCMYLSSINTVMHVFFQSRPTIEGFVIFQIFAIPQKCTKPKQNVHDNLVKKKIYKRQRCYIL